MFSDTDRAHMARALELAERGLYTTTPNPRVGCVIVLGGEVVGEGWHVRAGEPHAEVLALRVAGPRAAGATVYVTLESCVHHGRTPPCTAALTDAKVSRVVAAMADPNPLVAGKGFAALHAAGIETAVGLLESQARELNIGFVSRMTRGRPWVRLKIAASLDGKTALSNGRSQWITGQEARRDGHAWRARACAILTGIGTVKDDDPKLTVRNVATTRQPARVVVDSRLETPASAQVLGPGAIVAAAVQDSPQRAAVETTGAEVIVMRNDAGKVDLAALMRELARREMNEIHVEAGFKLNASLLREGLVDELVVYLAPSLLGHNARGMFDLPALEDLSGRHELDFTELRPIGTDIRVIARVRH